MGLMGTCATGNIVSSLPPKPKQARAAGGFMTFLGTALGVEEPATAVEAAAPLGSGGKEEGPPLLPLLLLAPWGLGGPLTDITLTLAGGGTSEGGAAAAGATASGTAAGAGDTGSGCTSTSELSTAWLTRGADTLLATGTAVAAVVLLLLAVLEGTKPWGVGIMPAAGGTKADLVGFLAELGAETGVLSGRGAICSGLNTFSPPPAAAALVATAEKAVAAAEG